MPDPALILYEGEEDKAFLKALLAHSGLTDSFSIHNYCQGKEAFGAILAGLVAARGIKARKAVILVVDNDGNPLESFQNIRTQIESAGFNVPASPRDLTNTDNLPAISVLMLPWDTDAGCLETLLLSAVNPAYFSQLECANCLVDCNHANNWDIPKKAKLLMRAFLSGVCRVDPNTGLRFAWKEGRGTPTNMFDLGSANFDGILAYLRTFV
jgi:hypothetical protein